MTTIAGEVASGFEPVRESFEADFARHGDIGAAVCVYQYGQPVVALWGGVAEPATGRPWTRNTIQLVYSATKGDALRVLVPREAEGPAPRSSSAHTVFDGTGPHRTPHRSANSSTSSSPYPDSACAATVVRGLTGSRSPRVSVTSIRSVTGATTVRASRKLRPGTWPCKAALVASSATISRAGSNGSSHASNFSAASSRASRAPRRVAERGTEK